MDEWLQKLEIPEEDKLELEEALQAHAAANQRLHQCLAHIIEHGRARRLP